MEKHKLGLGDTVRDKVTGAEGTITAKAEYLFGGTQFLFEYLGKDGSICSSWFSSDRFLLVNQF